MSPGSIQNGYVVAGGPRMAGNRRPYPWAIMATTQPQGRRSPAWHRNIDTPEKWARDHAWLLNAIFAAFDRDADWPLIERVQRALADVDTSRAVAVAQLAIDMPSELGARHGERLALTTRALSYCDEAAPLLAAFVGAIQLAVEVYRASDDEHPPVLSGFAVKDRLRLDDSTYIKVSRLLFQEPWFFGGGSGNVDEDWQHTVRVDVLLAEDVQGIADYLDAVARYRFGKPYVMAEGEAQEDAPVIRLERDWELGEEIGRGGFGRVVLARAGDQQAVAKFIPKEPGAGRELLFVDLGSARNVVPVIDHGETDDSWVLVMPRAEKSLRQHLEEKGASLPAEEVRAILTDVTTTLVDLAGKVVHRDIKPENVLLLDGYWCLADFGISRYAEATTAPDTHKFAMSPPYAAPERWRSERATGAADVYAVGVMGYEMLVGEPPFPGPHIEDFREQHLHSDPPPLDAGVGAGLASVIEVCLIKAPGARPRPTDMLGQLDHAAGPPTLAGLARLQEASRSQSGQVAAAARRASEADTEGQRRANLFTAALQSLQRMMDQMTAAIKAAAPAASVGTGSGNGWSLRLGHAQLRAFPPMQCSAQAAGQRLPFDVVACTDVELAVPPDTYGYEGRSHALWFCDAQEPGRYAWFETAFMVQPLMAQQTNRDPFSLRPGAEAGEAIGPGVGAYQVASPFTKLDDASLEAFISRWAGLFADAADGNLHRPSLPEGTTQGSWRRN